MANAVAYISDGTIDRFDYQQLANYNDPRFTRKFLIIDYMQHKHVPDQSSLLVGTDNYNAFMVNIKGYKKYVIQRKVFSAEIHYYIHLVDISKHGTDSISPMKKCNEYISQLMDITNSVNDVSLTHDEILANMKKLTNYIMSFVDYINAFDDGYMTCNTKSSA